MSTFLFDSRDDRCKTPFGAVPTDDVVTFRVFLPISYQLREPALLVYKADRWDSPERIPMHYEASDGVSCSYTCIFYSPDPQLYFYLFEVAGVNGKMRIARDQDGFGVLLPQGGEMWQLTVYDKAMRAPEFMKNGILYQIFPDRFCASGGAKSGVPSDRRLHRDWYELPEYLPDRNGEVTNSDYFGGDLRGITQKLTYLKSMGVGTIYLNPIFEAHSNHRYNTADFLRIDPLLGTEEDLRELCARAKALGIRVILDGVFNHTGADSVYFDKFGNYGTAEKYRSWFRFGEQYRHGYECWWDVPDLPNVEENDPSFREFLCGEDGVVRRWLRRGASGWRLDVADELPDSLIRDIRAAMKEEKEDSLLLGEVWEDASNKVSYGALREYFLGSELDATMHYPFRTAVLDFLLGKIHAQAACDAFWTIQEHYPKENLHAALNLIGSHDRARVLTVLGGDVNALKMAMFLQFALPGVPSIYYGDEAGMTGGTDPYNRGSFPWGKGNAPLTDFVRSLTAMYQETPLLRRGECEMLFFGENVLGCRRFDESGSVLALVNRGEEAVECFGVTVPGRGYILE